MEIVEYLMSNCDADLEQRGLYEVQDDRSAPTDNHFRLPVVLHVFYFHDLCPNGTKNCGRWPSNCNPRHTRPFFAVTPLDAAKECLAVDGLLGDTVEEKRSGSTQRHHPFPVECLVCGDRCRA